MYCQYFRCCHYVRCHYVQCSYYGNIALKSNVVFMLGVVVTLDVVINKCFLCRSWHCKILLCLVNIKMYVLCLNKQFVYFNQHSLFSLMRESLWSKILDCSRIVNLILSQTKTVPYKYKFRMNIQLLHFIKLLKLYINRKVIRNLHKVNNLPQFNIGTIFYINNIP